MTPARIANSYPHRIETFHTEGGRSLHFRLMGQHDGRAYIVNVQLSAEDTRTGVLLEPSEYAAVVTEVMQLLATQVTNFEQV